jgi:hypothetical protein
MPDQSMSLIEIYGGIDGFIEEFESNKEFIDLFLIMISVIPTIDVFIIY